MICGCRNVNWFSYKNIQGELLKEISQKNNTDTIAIQVTTNI